jgi:hypothetical protein
MWRMGPGGFALNSTIIETEARPPASARRPGPAPPPPQGLTRPTIPATPPRSRGTSRTRPRQTSSRPAAAVRPAVHQARERLKLTYLALFPRLATKLAPAAKTAARALSSAAPPLSARNARSKIAPVATVTQNGMNRFDTASSPKGCSQLTHGLTGGCRRPLNGGLNQ